MASEYESTLEGARAKVPPCAVFHNDFELGPATGALARELAALSEFCNLAQEMALVSGNATNAEALRAAIMAELSGPAPHAITVVSIPELARMSTQRLAGYGGPTSPESVQQRNTVALGRTDPEAVQAGCDEICNRILRQLGLLALDRADLWIVIDSHRRHNAAWTAALAEIVGRRERPVLSLWVRSLLVDGQCRYLANHAKIFGGEPFLQGSGVHTIVAHPGHAAVLERAGLRGVRYLPTVLPAHRVSENRRSNLPTNRRAGRRTVLSGSSAWLCSDTVRRESNIFEAALLALLVNPDIELTAPHVAHTPSEQSYTELVRHAFNEGTIRGEMGVAVTVDDYTTFDTWVSSSTAAALTDELAHAYAEGLAVVTRLEQRWEIEPLTLSNRCDNRVCRYESISIPLHSPSFSAPEALLRFRFGERFDRAVQILGTAAVEALREALDAALSTGWIDFSFLPPEMQYAYLRDARFDKGFRGLVAAGNEELLSAISTITAVNPGGRPLNDRPPYLITPKEFASRFGKVHRTVEAIETAAPTTGVVAKLTVDLSSLATFRLLLD